MYDRDISSVIKFWKRIIDFLYVIYSVFMRKMNTAVLRILKVFCVCVCVCGHSDLLLNFARNAKFQAGRSCFFNRFINKSVPN